MNLGRWLNVNEAMFVVVYVFDDDFKDYVLFNVYLYNFLFR